MNSIAPRLIMTGLISRGRIPTELKAFMETRKSSAALGRVGNVEYIANLALFLASEESSFITGQVIACDGGRTDKM